MQLQWRRNAPQTPQTSFRCSLEGISFDIAKSWLCLAITSKQGGIWRCMKGVKSCLVQHYMVSTTVACNFWDATDWRYVAHGTSVRTPPQLRSTVWLLWPIAHGAVQSDPVIFLHLVSHSIIATTTRWCRKSLVCRDTTLLLCWQGTRPDTQPSATITSQNSWPPENSAACPVD